MPELDLELEQIINFRQYPIDNEVFIEQCVTELDKKGVLTLPNFINNETLLELTIEAKENQFKAYYAKSTHNIYLTEIDTKLPPDHIFNYQVISSKGCITTDQIPENSKLKSIYGSIIFKDFLARVVNERKLYEYTDPFSSINIHYAKENQELGWHFDNSNFAVTLLLQKPEAGGEFEYVKNIRNIENNDMGYEAVSKIIYKKKKPKKLEIKPGTLVLFRGKNSMHRVTPTIGNLTRMLVVFAYNAKPGISLSKTAQKTFYGKTSEDV